VPERFALLLTVLVMASNLLSAQDTAFVAKSNSAHQALLDGRFDQAVKLYRELVAQLPSNPGLRLNLGLALEKAGQPAAAVSQLQVAAQALPGNAGVHFLLGLAYQQLNQPRQAIAPLRESLRLDASNKQALFELADAELTTGDFPAAARDFHDLSVARPDMAKAWQGAARAYRRWSEQLTLDLRQAAPQSGYAKALAARSQAAEQHFGAALSLYRQALQLVPSLPGVHNACALIYRQTGHAEWAAVEEAREPTDCVAPATACAYAKSEYQAVLASREENVENLYWRALAAARLSEQSLESLARLPPSAARHEVLAESYQQAGRRLEAVEEWRRALALAPNDRRLEGRLADSLYRARIYPEAEQILIPLSKTEPENAEWQYLLGSVLLQQERSAEALPYLERAIRLQPGFLPAEENLGHAYLNAGKPAEAIAHLEKARPLDDGALSFALSSAYRKLGRLDESRGALTRYREFKEQKASTAEPELQPVITPP
jgi:tetratricopeptide (TPR) repeat protein